VRDRTDTGASVARPVLPYLGNVRLSWKMVALGAVAVVLLVVVLTLSLGGGGGSSLGYSVSTLEQTVQSGTNHSLVADGSNENVVSVLCVPISKLAASCQLTTADGIQTSMVAYDISRGGTSYRTAPVGG
jgi:hypothetical protein